MKLLEDRRGISRIEAFCITGISVLVLLLLVSGVRWYQVKMKKGNDAMLVNTAQSAAAAETADGACPVRNCGGGAACTHHTSQGYTGYFDRPTNTIQAKKGKGYNEYSVMAIDGREYKGEPGTMVIRVVCRDGKITLSWVKGDN